jgi:hypothetical protein
MEQQRTWPAAGAGNEDLEMMHRHNVLASPHCVLIDCRGDSEWLVLGSYLNDSGALSRSGTVFVVRQEEGVDMNADTLWPECWIPSYLRIPSLPSCCGCSSHIVGGRVSCTRRSFPLSIPNCIIPGGLYLGDGASSACSLEMLQFLGIRRVVNASNREYPNTWEGLSYLNVDIVDNPLEDLSCWFDPVVKFVRGAAAGEATLVHCAQGMSRSAALVIAFLMATGASSSLREAAQLCATRRPLVYPNDGFVDALLKYEQHLFGVRSISGEWVRFCDLLASGK